jgi:hypothetical protein
MKEETSRQYYHPWKSWALMSLYWIICGLVGYRYGYFSVEKLVSPQASSQSQNPWHLIAATITIEAERALDSRFARFGRPRNLWAILDCRSIHKKRKWKQSG